MRNDERLAILETVILNINTNLIDIKHDIRRLDNKIDVTKKDLNDKMDSKFHAIDEKFQSLEGKLDGKFQAIDTRFQSIENRLWSNFLWLISMMIGLAGLIAHAQHWI